MRDTDVFICGGGPAGLAAAIAARQQGFEVMVADCFKPPIDKACGEGLMPDSLAALGELGVSLDGCKTGVFHGIRFVEGGKAVEACFPKGVGRGIRRIQMHNLLHEHAAAMGVRFLWSTQVMGVADDVVRAGSRDIRTRWIVGADGLHSRIRKWANLDAGKTMSERVGIRQHFKVRPWSRFVEVHWSASSQAYITPVGANEVCVAVIAQRKVRSIADVLHMFPELAGHLHGAEHGSAEIGSATTGRIYNRVTRGRTALVGDASGSVDALSGDGLALSFLQARALGVALKQGDLGLYEKAHREIRRVPTFMSQTMLLMDKYGTLRRKSMATFHRNPWLFERMLSVHVGATPLTLWGRNGMLNMGLQLLSH